MRQHNELVVSLVELHTGNVHIDTFFELRLELLQDEIAHLAVGLLQVTVVDDGVEVAGRGAVGQFGLGRVQTLAQTLLGLRLAISEALLELLDGWRFDEDEDRVEMRVSDLLDALDFDVQYANLAQILNVLDGLFAKIKKAAVKVIGELLRCSPGPIHVTAENCRLDELSVLDSSLHRFNAHEVIVDAVLLSIARLSGRVRDAEAESIRKLLEESLEKSALARSRRTADHQRTRSLLDHLVCEGCDD